MRWGGRSCLRGAYVVKIPKTTVKISEAPTNQATTQQRDYHTTPTKAFPNKFLGNKKFFCGRPTTHEPTNKPDIPRPSMKCVWCKLMAWTSLADPQYSAE